MTAPPNADQLVEAPLAWPPSEIDVSLSHADPQFVLRHDPMSEHPYFGAVELVRIDGDSVGAAVAASRNWFAAHNRTQSSWWVRESANRSTLIRQLLSHGLRFSPDDPHGVALMRLEGEPSAVSTVTVRRVECLEDDLVATRVFSTVFGIDGVGLARIENMMKRRWQNGPPESRVGFLAYLDHLPVARGNVVFAGHAGALYSGATLPSARGRGCYRALVYARWEALQRRGGRDLVVQAGRHSEPILTRLGFRTVDRLTVLVDRIDAEPRNVSAGGRAVG